MNGHDLDNKDQILKAVSIFTRKMAKDYKINIKIHPIKIRYLFYKYYLILNLYIDTAQFLANPVRMYTYKNIF